MMDWIIAEDLHEHTRAAVDRWWSALKLSPGSEPSEALVEDLQAARLALEQQLNEHLWRAADVLPPDKRKSFEATLHRALDPWHDLADQTSAAPDMAASSGGGLSILEEEPNPLIGQRRKAWNRERLRPPRVPNQTRQQINDVALGRLGKHLALEDENICRMLSYGAWVLDLIDAPPSDQQDRPLADISSALDRLSADDFSRCAEAALEDPLVGAIHRGRPAEFEVTTFIRQVFLAVENHTGHRLRSTRIRNAAKAGGEPVSGPDLRLLTDLLACHRPSMTPDAARAILRSMR
jgi:hypothetical protein